MKDLKAYIEIPVEQEPEQEEDEKIYYTDQGPMPYLKGIKYWMYNKRQLTPLWYGVEISITEYMSEAIESYHEAYIMLQEADLLYTLPTPKEYVLEYLTEKGVMLK